MKPSPPVYLFLPHPTYIQWFHYILSPGKYSMCKGLMRISISSDEFSDEFQIKYQNASFWWKIIVSKWPVFFAQACPRGSIPHFQKWLRYRGTSMSRAEMSTIPKKYLGFANVFALGEGEFGSVLWSAVEFACSLLFLE